MLLTCILMQVTGYFLNFRHLCELKGGIVHQETVKWKPLANTKIFGFPNICVIKTSLTAAKRSS